MASWHWHGMVYFTWAADSLFIIAAVYMTRIFVTKEHGVSLRTSVAREWCSV